MTEATVDLVLNGVSSIPGMLAIGSLLVGVLVRSRTRIVNWCDCAFQKVLVTTGSEYGQTKGQTPWSYAGLSLVEVADNIGLIRAHVDLKLRGESVSLQNVTIRRLEGHLPLGLRDEVDLSLEMAVEIVVVHWQDLDNFYCWAHPDESGTGKPLSCGKWKCRVTIVNRDGQVAGVRVYYLIVERGAPAKFVLRHQVVQLLATLIQKAKRFPQSTPSIAGVTASGSPASPSTT